jgi:hypothetical protein
LFGNLFGIWYSSHFSSAIGPDVARVGGILECSFH